MMARALALNGAHKVYIIGRRKEVLEKASKSVSTNNIIPLVGDVNSKGTLSSIVSHISSEDGYINLLIANSGTLGPQASQKITSESTVADYQKAWGETSFDEFADTFKLNTVAVWFTAVAFLGLLDAGNKKGNVEQKSQVIATSSIGGFNRNVPGGFAYGQSKAATTHMMKQLATNLAPIGIRSNILAPGCEFSFQITEVLKSRPFCFISIMSLFLAKNVLGNADPNLFFSFVSFCSSESDMNSVPVRARCWNHRRWCFPQKSDSLRENRHRRRHGRLYPVSHQPSRCVLDRKCDHCRWRSVEHGSRDLLKESISLRWRAFGEGIPKSIRKTIERWWILFRLLCCSITKQKLERLLRRPELRLMYILYFSGTRACGPTVS
jgi:NAD(P)-dependent dehydrogenase (short-subunit alcohol dehydrogenase family)